MNSFRSIKAVSKNVMLKVLNFNVVFTHNLKLLSSVV